MSYSGTPGDPFRPDFLLRLDRARDHLQNLADEVGSYIEAVRHTMMVERYEELPEVRVAFVFVSEPARDPFAILVGDALQCMRTALDQLAFELATSSGTPMNDDIKGASAFPVFGDERGPGKGAAAFSSKRGRANIQAVDPAAQQIIERLQPYHRGTAYSADPLWRLHALNISEKHRLLPVVAGVMRGIAADESFAAFLGRLSEYGTVASLDWGGGPSRAQGRTFVASWHVPEGADEPVEPPFRPSIEIKFADDGSSVAGLNVLEVLTEIYNYLGTEVVDPLLGFLK